MGRKKLVLEGIARKTSKWKETFRKRKASLFKKASELSTLCDVDTCVVLFDGPDDPTPVTWPPRADEAMAIVSLFLSVPEAERAKKMLRAESFLPQQVQVQAQAQVPEMLQLQLQEMQLELQKTDRQNRELEAAVFLNDVLSGQSTIADVASSMESIAVLSALVQKRAYEVNRRISELASVSVPQPPPDPLMTPEMGTTSAALSPGWCGEAVNEFVSSFFADEVADEGTPPLMTPDDGAPIALSPMTDCGKEEKELEDLLQRMRV
ncbi:hypothetical protein LUZ61_004138 [Rhynchospora tenuis]|uniref:MADS-box domain-containing protein n=1 Tax=Rhynchospora tenuis TaxID=198213 RepID=A0AAD5ZM86_9POAL|nr:hypothetical protein LUZ61_004138 [Rhynchospora tenuis]